MLSIIARGLVGRLGRVLRKGAIYGEDLILKNPKLRKEVATTALTYTELLSIDQTCFLELVEHAPPQDAAEVRWGVVRLAVIRGIMMLADRIFEDDALRDQLLDGQGLPVESDERESPLPIRRPLSRSMSHRSVCSHVGSARSGGTPASSQALVRRQHSRTAFNGDHQGGQVAKTTSASLRTPSAPRLERAMTACSPSAPRPERALPESEDAETVFFKRLQSLVGWRQQGLLSESEFLDAKGKLGLGALPSPGLEVSTTSTPSLK